MDQVASLESSQEMSRRQERQQARQLKDLERSLKDAQHERIAAETRLASLQELRAAEAQNMMQELGGNTKHIEERLTKKEEENAELHRILDRSNDELSAARQEIQNLRDIISNSEASEQESKAQTQLQILTSLGARTSNSQNDPESPISRPSSSMSLPSERPLVYRKYPTISQLSHQLIPRGSIFMADTTLLGHPHYNPYSDIGRAPGC